MTDRLFASYERELRYIHQLAQEFRERFPKEGLRLRLEPSGNSSDADVERLLESFALLSARSRDKIDDEFPEISDALLQVLYPHFLAPIPAMQIVQLEADPTRTQIPGGHTIPAGSYLNTTKADPIPCKYRTVYPIVLWPLHIAEARFQPPPFPGLSPPDDAAAALRLQVQCVGQLRWQQLQLDRLRLYLHGDDELVADLYEALFSGALQVVFRSPSGEGDPVTLPAEACIHPVGFAPNESLLPSSPWSHLGYRLLTELFTFPKKFAFFDLAGWRRIAQTKFGETCEVVIFFKATNSKLEQQVTADSLRIGVRAVVNLFEKTAEPIPLRPLRHEYRIVMDKTCPGALEVYGVQRVTSEDPVSRQVTEYAPFHSLRHDQAADAILWHTVRRKSLVKDDRGTDVYLAPVDMLFETRWPSAETLQVQTLCTNRDLPTKVGVLAATSQSNPGFVDFRLEAPAPVKRVRGMTPPTPPLRPPERRGGFWRIISHLTPNYLSIQGVEQALPALREILSLYDFADPDAGQQHLTNTVRQMIEGLVGVQSRRVLGRVHGADGLRFCRGMEITVALDPTKYPRTGALLFAAVLEHYFSLYVTANSFTRTAVLVQDRLLKKWPPRVGALPLL